MSLNFDNLHSNVHVMNLSRLQSYSWQFVIWVYVFFSILFSETEFARDYCYCYFLNPVCNPEWRTVILCKPEWIQFKRGLRCFCNCKRISLNKLASHYPASGNAPSILFLFVTSHYHARYQIRMNLNMRIRSENVCYIKVMSTWISNLFYIFMHNIDINSANFIVKIALLSK